MKPTVIEEIFMSNSSNVNVHVESTPNPATLKFVFSGPVTEHTAEFSNAQDAERSPLASKLFGFPWTQAVYIAPQFVSVTKQDWVDWDVLAEPLSGLIKEHLDAGLPLLLDGLAISNDENPNDSEIVKRIKQALNRDVRPVVALDGGDVVFAKFENQILSLQMKGACAGCPSSSATLKEGIEVRMRELFPEIKEVVSV
jgi:Fe-S cluster biogenesis protein NfuA